MKLPFEHDNVLEVDGLVKTFKMRGGRKRGHGPNKPELTRALDGVSFSVRRGDTLGIAGESGCGKSTLLRCLVGAESPDEGELYFADEGQPSGTDSARYQLAWVPQNPYSSLDPRMTILDIVREPLVGLGKKMSVEAVEDLLDLVELPSYFTNRYPHQLSGGERQRVSIARGLSVDPSLLLLDEPVSALDVSVQATVLGILKRLQQVSNVSMVMVAHDLAVIGSVCNRVVIMYLGKIVEEGAVRDVFENPLHPYTQALLASVPTPDPQVERHRKRILLAGEAASLGNATSGCPFRVRCPLYASKLTQNERKTCDAEVPRIVARTPELSHKSACHHPSLASAFWNEHTGGHKEVEVV